MLGCSQDLMKITVVIESLSLKQSNVLYKRKTLPGYKNKYNENKYLTEEQARHVYKKVESGNIININALKQETELDQELNRLDDTSRDINPYRE